MSGQCDLCDAEIVYRFANGIQLCKDCVSEAADHRGRLHELKRLRQQLAALNQPVPLSEWQKMEQQLAECREEREWLLDDVAKFRGERNALREELAELRRIANELE
jgi:uncharacterized coiled-coil DUF342 family protein